MAVSVTVESVVKNPDGSWQFTTNRGGLLFGSLQEMQTYRDDLDHPNSYDNAIAIALKWWMARSSDGSNPNLIKGKTVTFDLGAANPIRVQ